MVNKRFVNMFELYFTRKTMNCFKIDIQYTYISTLEANICHHKNNKFNIFVP